MSNTESSRSDETSQWGLTEWLLLAVSAFGLYLTLYGAAIGWQVFRTRDWPVVEGTVVDLQTLEDGVSAEFIVEYEYDVGGTKYRGTWGDGPNHGRGHPGADSDYEPLGKLIEEFETNYGVGKSISVHYNPGDPADPFIESEENAAIAGVLIAALGIGMAVTLPLSRRRRRKHAWPDTEETVGDDVEGDDRQPAHGAAIAAPSSVSSEVDPHAVELLGGGATWNLGTRVEFHRAAISNQFLWFSGLAGAAAAGLGVYLLIANGSGELETVSQALGIASLASIGFLVPILFLQGLWPSRHVAFDWGTESITVTVAGNTVSYPISAVDRLVFRSGMAGMIELDAVGESIKVRLFDATDRGFARATELSAEHLLPAAAQLAETLGVPLERTEPQLDPIVGIWGRSPMVTRAALIGVGVVLVLYVIGLTGRPITFAGLGVAIAPVLVSLSRSGSPGSATGTMVRSTSGGAESWLAWVAFLLLLGALSVSLSLFASLTTVGTVVAAAILTWFLLACVVTPDLVASQRAGLTVPAMSLLSQRLRGRSVRRQVAAASALRAKGWQVPMAAIDQVDSRRGDEPNGQSHGVEELVVEIEKAARRGEFAMVPVTPSTPDDQQKPSVRSLGTHVQMLVGAALGLAVVGFFFVVTDGPTYVDILLVEREWKETDATIDRVIPGVGRDALTRFVFSYSVDESAFTSTCYGPDSLANESPVRARYDGNQPEVANLVGGWRAGGSPVLPMFFFAILLLIVIPLPIAIGHAIASLLAGNPTL